MKKIVLSAVTLSLLLTAFAAPKRYTLVTNATSWNVSTNWSPLGIPADGDSVTIPENKNLTLSSDLTYSDLYIDIYGALVLSGSNMKILLKSVSTVKVHTSGTLSGSKASQQLVLGTTIIFKGDQSALTGPVMATS